MMVGGESGRAAELSIRPEGPGDQRAVRRVNEEAFGGAVEADLVEALRAAGAVTLSLVAEQDDRIVGHILFSPVTIGAGTASGHGLALGPMAVVPDLQRRGIGGRLVEAGLDACRRAGHERVVVVGHPAYYPRFGFVPASRFGLACEFEVPDEVFMALELRAGAYAEVAGTVRYRPEFARAGG